MKLTADTITDEQLRELRNDALKAGDTDLVVMCHDALPGTYRWVDVADWGESRPVPEADRMDARARCAEILNARAKGVQ